MGLEELVGKFFRRFTAGVVEVADAFGSTANLAQRLFSRGRRTRYDPDSIDTLSARTFRWAYPRRKQDYTIKDHLPRWLGNVAVGKLGLAYVGYKSIPYLGHLVPQGAYNFFYAAGAKLGISQSWMYLYTASIPGFWLIPAIVGAGWLAYKAAKYLSGAPHHHRRRHPLPFVAPGAAPAH